MSNELSRANRVRYTMYSDILSPLQISEPDGWNDDEKELLRSEKYFGVMTSLSNNLEFYGDSKEYLKSNYDQRGIKANVRLEKEERNSQTDEWELSYSGYFDFSTYQSDKTTIKIKFNESQFFKNIESRIKEKYELSRLDDLKGNPIPALSYKTLSLQGRDIFRKSEMRNDQHYWMYRTSSPFVIDFFALPFTLIYRSDENFFAPSIAVNPVTGEIDNNTAFANTGGISIGQAFYDTADNTREATVKVKGDFKFQYFGGSTEPIDFLFYRVLYDRNTNTFISGSQIFDKLTPTFSLTSASGQVTKSVDFSTTFNKRIDECLFITAIWQGDAYPMRVDYTGCTVTMEETQESTTSDCDTLRVYDVLDRLLRIITGKQCFQSDLLNNEWRDLLFTSGFKIRGFDDKNITTSLEEVLDGLMAIDDVALIIQNDTVRLEKKSLAFDNTVSIDVGEVSNLKRKIIENLHYSSIDIGYDFDGKYEEVNGLDEYNIKNTYATCIDTVENLFKAVSKIKADAYGVTLAQLKPFTSYPKLDTQYDRFNYFLDSKLVSGTNYVLRHWQDDFASQPTGIFSPDTAFNLRLSPFNSLLRKGKTISVGLKKFPTELLKYSSTDGNSQLVTLYPERAVIQNSVLSYAYYLPEEISFNKKITLMQFRTIINNPYKLIKFVNEYGDVEYGFIAPGSQGIKPNKEGKFTLIKANF